MDKTRRSLGGDILNSSRFTDRLLREQDSILKQKDFVAKAKAQLSFHPDAYRRPQSRLRTAAAGVGMAAAAAVFAIIVWQRPAPPSPITAALDGKSVAVGEWISGAHDTKKKLAFSDGSGIALSKNAGLRIQSLDVNGAYLLLEHGSLKADIAHREKTRWKLNVGPYSIEVKGTRFTVGWTPETRSFRLDLQEGAVNVSGPMLRVGLPMSAGEKMVASLSEERVEIEDATQMKTIIFNGGGKEPIETSVLHLSNDSSALLESAPVLKEESDKETPVAKNVQTWKAMARAGRYSDAVSAAKRSGVSQILKTESASDLMTLGDAARRSNENDLAAQAYKTVRRRFADSVHASGAAFALGIIAFDHQNAFRDAAKWFEACLRSKKPGAFSREASGRLIEALDRAGDSAGAKQAAHRYLDNYSDGPHAPLARKITANN
jgi:hypothetical protein